MEDEWLREMLTGWLGCDGLSYSSFHLSINASLTIASDEEFIAHIVQHGHVWHTEKDSAEEVVSDESVASKS